MEETNKRAGQFLQAISDGKVKSQELKQAIEQVSGAEDKRQLNIRSILQAVEISVKQPEINQNRG